MQNRQNFSRTAVMPQLPSNATLNPMHARDAETNSSSGRNLAAAAIADRGIPDSTAVVLGSTSSVMMSSSKQVRVPNACLTVASLPLIVPAIENAVDYAVLCNNDKKPLPVKRQTGPATRRVDNGAIAAHSQRRLPIGGRISMFAHLMLLLFAVPHCLALKCVCRDTDCPRSECDPGKNGKCYKSLRYDVFVDGITHERHVSLVASAGCHKEDSALLHCKAHLSPHQHPFNISCCSNYDYCNADLDITVPSTTPSVIDVEEIEGNDKSEKALLWLIIGTLCVVVMVLIACVGIVVCWSRKWRAKAGNRHTSGPRVGDDAEMNGSTRQRYWTAGDESGVTMVTHVSDGLARALLPASSLTPRTRNISSAATSSYAVSTNGGGSSRRYESSLQGNPHHIYAGDDDDAVNSGSNEWVLTERTIAKQLQDVEEIGKGRYGKVLRSKLKGEDVAVKVFSSVDEQSWQREKDIYLTCMLRHENILGFIAADIRSRADTATEMIMICDFHPYGSLFDFLQAWGVVNADLMLQLAHSAAAGLAHLHEEVLGTNSKPGVAHRDIKSKNILVKKDLSCCIADFGLAVRLDMQTRQIVPSVQELRVQQGTKRYMAPEVLDLENMHEAVGDYAANQHRRMATTSSSAAAAAAPLRRFRLEDFECYRHADIYSFALVLWELNNRCDVNGQTIWPYQLPYDADVSPDPSIEEMYEVVVVRRVRPSIVARPDWSANELQSVFNKKSMTCLMMECWNDAECRPTADRIKKHLRMLMNARQQLQQPNYGYYPGASITATSSSYASSHMQQKPFLR